MCAALTSQPYGEFGADNMFDSVRPGLLPDSFHVGPNLSKWAPVLEWMGAARTDTCWSETLHEMLPRRRSC